MCALVCERGMCERSVCVRVYVCEKGVCVRVYVCEKGVCVCERCVRGERELCAGFPSETEQQGVAEA